MILPIRFVQILPVQDIRRFGIRILLNMESVLRGLPFSEREMFSRFQKIPPYVLYDRFIVPENKDEFFTNAQRSRIVSIVYDTQ